jgi:hypothetical protein
MDTELFAGILIFLGAVLAAVLFVLDRAGKRLSEAIPPELLPVLMGLLALAETLAATTPTKDDDELIAKIKAALQPTPEPSPFATPGELAARLDPLAQG